MRVWRFYLKNKEEKGYELYALTNKKDMAKEFMSIRDMDIFVVVKTKMDESEWLEVSTENRLAILRRTDLVTRVVNDNGLIGTEKVDVILTEYEIQACDGDYNISVLLDEEYWYNEAPPYTIFQEEYQNALREIGYNADYNFHKSMHDEVVEPEVMDFPNTWIDELSLFLKTFSYTLKM